LLLSTVLIASTSVIDDSVLSTKKPTERCLESVVSEKLSVGSVPCPPVAGAQANVVLAMAESSAVVAAPLCSLSVLARPVVVVSSVFVGRYIAGAVPPLSAAGAPTHSRLGGGAETR